MKQKEQQHPLKGIKWGIANQAVYRGVIVNRLVGGYMLLNKICLKETEVDIIIDNATRKLETTIIS